jgi:hypothetical protein
VTAVGSAEEALDVLQRERPAVLLSDLSTSLVSAVAALKEERIGRLVGGTASVLRVLMVDQPWVSPVVL